MKYFLYLLFSLILNLSNAQIKSGIIDYGVIAHMPPPKDSEFVVNQIKKMNATDTLVNYKLNFNKNESCFFIEPAILNGYENEEEFSSHLMIQPKYYVSSKDSIFRFYENNKFIGKYTIDLRKESKWILTNETKMIGDFLCYKAISPFFNGEMWFDDNPKLNVIAWYAPKIPVPFGPNGYHGLPGLILELQTVMSTIYTKKINLNQKDETFIDNLTKYKSITLGQKKIAMSRMLSREQQEFVEENEKKRKERELTKKQ